MCFVKKYFGGIVDKPIIITIDDKYIAEGNVSLNIGSAVLYADKLIYDQLESIFYILVSDVISHKIYLTLYRLSLQ